ncbi:MAG TPA: ATP-binding protein [Parachlamydiales bacterium]|nr:ATP-binding protein [Parachlamydiales bacterium]
MKRLMDWHLQQWKIGRHRKPLLLRGARQVGKTFAARKLGESFDHFVEVNFEYLKETKKIFDKDLRPERLVQELSILLSQDIVPGSTLLFFDEIQECHEALKSLRYFYEVMPSLHVLAAGSLLDFAIEKIGIPVGRVESLYCYPLSFFEFLAATGHSQLAGSILEHSNLEPIAEVVHQKTLELVGHYLAIGGMPEVVARWIESRNPRECFSIFQRLIDTYRQDFGKYSKEHQVKYVTELFNEMPRQIGKQFKYSAIHGEYKKRELAPGLDLLCTANIVHKIHHTAGHGLPLGAESKPEWFKILFLDIALCQSILGLNLGSWLLDPHHEFVNRGAIAEAFVGQELLCYASPYRKQELYFWKKGDKQAQAEIDFLFEHQGAIIPLEVKSGDGRTLKSLHLFLQTHCTSPYGIRFSVQNYSRLDHIFSRPLYDIVSLAHEDQKESLFHLVASTGNSIRNIHKELKELEP